MARGPLHAGRAQAAAQAAPQAQPGWLEGLELRVWDAGCGVEILGFRL